MKQVNLFKAAIFTLFVGLTSCSDDDTPELINEEEVITTLTVTLTPDDGSATVILQSQDLDGTGADITVSGVLLANTNYSGSIVLLNETVSPAEDITLEVIEEAEEHQFFYTVGSGLNITTSYDNFDSNDNPLGTEFTAVTGEASNGTLTFTLRHEPTKPNTGISDAGGETDILASFNVVVQ
ncbi:type 1 periplasmic binding fold superfamily protein [Cellulophaga tyrosinoxydans]|uniref:Type 1 periplasmic binding fold superfamily protein n=1 Tax=Cellulophaga tyrosinoxydans TaxID=504486 RepID=A0A1W2BG85_9FLAO|nr:type 1 periplasmic binding fold superfamily protein [Cellulophaga tyrosinoxydans]SMC71977.1 hypothetical protein SAMN05660703_2389 [Cellulophaga tyrosinoxydans]